MKVLSKNTLLTLFLALIIFFTFISRFQNLGYSDYQGDEIKAFFNPKEDGDYFKFLLDQRKGPNQFIVTGLLKGISNNFQNYFITRFPFALAGFLSIIVFYFVVKKLDSKEVAVYASIFFATNGFLIAFSRIVQYQAFVILFGLLGIFLYQKFLETKKFWLIIVSFVSFAISILFHYDGVFFGIPVLFWIVKDLLIAKKEGSKTYYKFLIGGIAIALSMLLAFYIPFVLNITDKTKDYWLGRISGEVSNKISSSYYLFTVYQPIYSIHFYLILILLGIAFGIYHQEKKYIPILVWALIPFIFLEGLVSIPGTHIYTYLIPAMIIMGIGISKSIEFIKNLKLKIVGYVGVLILFIFLSLQGYTIFVDHNKEYPWQEKKFLFFTLNKPTPIFHLSMFGFPYNREWQEIGKILGENKDDFFSTNERVSLTRYYIANQKDGEKARFFVFIENPQTFTNEITNQRTKSWAGSNKPIKEIISRSGNKILIYEIPKDFVVKNQKTETNSEEN